MILEAALTATLLFTVPSKGRAAWTSNDTSYVECSGGPAITSLLKSRLFYQPSTGGGYRMLLEKSATGKAGMPDSFVFDPGAGGHFYVVATNGAGTSCASNVVYVRGSTVTGIESEEALRPGDRLTSSRIFDVQGRQMQASLKALRSGVYWRVDRYASGVQKKKRMVIVK